ncbi:hypothetical protein N7492_000627 [Penicillium capsulatum]|uniref:ABC multidrug transporter MDR2 n=1 Tax=Penicillium capsulatum TaxID=69766 RepID=A0A9W9LYQ0_9EURO|nr:hypothetical protein N7492_000627 [Penicillium capsulatum]KAJ6130315.1 hypothetical protein N7512_003095 [Penicillium capsulatum]
MLIASIYLSWRRSPLSVKLSIPQTHIFKTISSTITGTIRDNILLGMNSDTVTDQQLDAVCRDASIHDFITPLPESCNTDIGSRDITLSGGQKQCITIARALIRNPSALLLDEATSSLDSESERSVQADFERAAKGRTMIAVAHRLATVQSADVIFVLGEDGKVMEKGSHFDLTWKKGVNYQMLTTENGAKTRLLINDLGT